MAYPDTHTCKDLQPFCPMGQARLLSTSCCPCFTPSAVLL